MFQKANNVLMRSVLQFSFLVLGACNVADETPVRDQGSPTASAVAVTPTLEPTLTLIPSALPEPTAVPIGKLEPRPSLTPTAEIQEGRMYTETRMLQFEEGGSVQSIEVSPDGLHLAHRVVEGNQMYVVLDGKPDKPYDVVYELTFSPDSQHLAYIAREGDQEFVVHDGVVQLAYDQIVESWGSSVSQVLQFSPDGQRLAYRAYLDGKPRIVVDGEEYPYAGIQFEIIFSPDSQHVAYTAGNLNDEWFMVVDGAESQKFDEIPGYGIEFGFSPNSQRFAFQGRRGDQWFMVIDGVESAPLDNFVLDLAFSPDSQHVAYDAERNGRMSIELDGVELESYSRAIEPVFSPDSQRLAYKAKRGDGWFVVVEGVEGPICHGWPIRIQFSPDSQKLAYIDENEVQVLMINDQASEPYRRISRVVFSPDSQRVAYNIFDGEDWLVIVDGEAITTLDFTHYNHRFSPDSAHLVYSADLEDGEAVYVDGLPGPVYEDILSREIYFDIEGNIFYYAIKEDGLYLVNEKLD